MPTAKLNATARDTLRWAGLTMSAWARRHGCSSASAWRGDECGCPDDRCIGYHHAADEDCGCLPALIEELQREERQLEGARPVWAAHLVAIATGKPEDHDAAARLASAWIETYMAGTTWHAFSEVPRGIVYGNIWNDRTWLVYDADADSVSTREVAA